MSKNIKIYLVGNFSLLAENYRKSLYKDVDIKSVKLFDSAEDVLYELKFAPPDIIIMDIELPFMNGIEAIDMIKKLYPTQKIIILSSRDNYEELLACLSLGAKAYVFKNSVPDSLTAIVRVVYLGGIWIEPKLYRMVKTCIPSPCSTNLDKLYPFNSKIAFTKREKEILRLMVDGKTNPEIAKEIVVSVNTVKANTTKIFEKLFVKDRVQAVAKAVRYDLF